jgi:hypothetical protein
VKEVERLQFVLERDGIDGVLSFAERTKRIYRKAVLRNGRNGRAFHFGSIQQYRRSFIESYLACKDFTKKYGSPSQSVSSHKRRS